MLSSLQLDSYRRPHALAGLILKTTMVAWIPAQCIHLILQAVYPGPKAEMLFLDSKFQTIALLIFIAPVLETYGLRFMLYAFSRLLKSEATVQILAATFWGVMHWESESWGLYAVWAFYIMGKWFLRARAHGVQYALYTTMVIHALFNGLSYAVYLLQEG